ncbi:MAG: hypothetical protein HEP71_05495 [Roseivirga sp.]|nr:hypothetical protein [Roseivirga sp.]
MVTEKIIAFLDSIGISVVKTKISQDTFLPGIIINKGIIEYDPQLLKYPGDLLHEAGHIAVLAPQDRKKVAGDLRDYQTPSESDELGAILWSYAALTYLNIAPEIVFHENGYKNNSQWLIDQFENGTYIGLPYLEWKGMTDQQIFPKVHRWLAQ